MRQSTQQTRYMFLDYEQGDNRPKPLACLEQPQTELCAKLKTELAMQNEYLLRTQQALKEAKNRYSELYHLAPIGYLTFDQAGNILQLNVNAAKLLGIPVGDLVEQSINQFLTAESKMSFYTHQQAVLETLQPQTCELALCPANNPSQALIYVQMESVVGRDDYGKLLHIRSAITDITSRKQAELELQQHRHQLEATVIARTAELMTMNEKLQQEIHERRQAEQALQQAYEVLEQRVAERTAELQESKQRYKRLLESVTNYVYTVNIKDGTPVSTIHGPGCFPVTGYMPDEYADDIYLWHKMVHEADCMLVLERANKLIAGELVPPLEHRILHKDGSLRWVQNRSVSRKNSKGEVIAYDGIIIDITARKQAEEIYRTLVEHSLLGLAIVQNSRLIFANLALTDITGYSVDELVTMSADEFWQIVYPADQQQVQRRFQSRSEGKYLPIGFGFRVIRKDQALRWVEAFASPIDYQGTPALEISFVDITARKLAEQEKEQLFEAVSRQREQLRALSGRLSEAQETERKQLARELHDQVGQNLTALGFNLNLIASQLETECPQTSIVQNRLQDSLQILEGTSDKIYNVMADLHPPVLDDYGLVVTLKWYSQQWAERVALNVVVEGDELIPRLPSLTENALFRIAQEALTNIAKHAQAERVTITVYDSETMRLVIKDDGVGFDPNSPTVLTERQHWGLISMQERAEAIGGRFQIISQPNQGTQIIVEVSRL